MSIGDFPLLACLALTLFNAGWVWFLQLNHYPLYAAVGREAHPGYMAGHNARLLWPVIVPGALAFIFSLWLAVEHPLGVPGWAVWLIFAINIMILASTALLQGPAHLRLEREGFSEALIEKIVATNWARTLGWTFNAAMLLWMTASLLGARH